MVRAKFWVQSAKRWQPAPKESGGEVVLIPVYSTDPNHENKAFWDATPSGQITMSISNPPAFAQFEAHLGKEFYIDITPVE
jgi:hypothetical protein